MPGSLCERAIDDALEAGHALPEFISPNNAGATASHQCGFYLPHKAWQPYSPKPPRKGNNLRHEVTIIWQNELTTSSMVTWHGNRTRNEFRLTRFGRDFRHFGSEAVGNLPVLVPRGGDRFKAYTLESEEDIEQIQAALDVEVHGSWGIFAAGRPLDAETDQCRCIDRHSIEFAAYCDELPSREAFALASGKGLSDFLPRYRRHPPTRD